MRSRLSANASAFDDTACLLVAREDVDAATNLRDGGVVSHVVMQAAEFPSVELAVRCDQVIVGDGAAPDAYFSIIVVGSKGTRAPNRLNPVGFRAFSGAARRCSSSDRRLSVVVAPRAACQPREILGPKT